MNKCGNSMVCSKCIMSENLDDIKLNDENVCNICSTPVTKELVSKRREMIKNYKEFLEHSTKKDKPNYYDCMLMLSGGKDSIYMLYKLTEIDKMKPLAFTFNHPFESKHAIHNIENVIKKLKFEHVNFSPNIDSYRKIMHNAFTLPKENICSDIPFLEKLPCLICSCYIRISAFLMAYKLGIPYIMYCADPFQMTGMELNQINEVVKVFTSILPEALLEEVLGNQLDILRNITADMPKFIFPYVAMPEYNKNRIISELKGLNLYSTSSVETRCSLNSLLNYYSFKRYNTYLYSRNISTMIRGGDVSRENALKFIDEYKNIMMNLSPMGNLTSDNRLYIKKVFKSMFPQNSEEQLEFECNDIMALCSIANQLDINLDRL